MSGPSSLGVLARGLRLAGAISRPLDSRVLYGCTPPCCTGATGPGSRPHTRPNTRMSYRSISIRCKLSRIQSGGNSNIVPVAPFSLHVPPDWSSDRSGREGSSVVLYSSTVDDNSRANVNVVVQDLSPLTQDEYHARNRRASLGQSASLLPNLPQQCHQVGGKQGGVAER